MDTISNNLANVETTRGADGEPYRRQQVVFQERPTAYPASFHTHLMHQLTLKRTRVQHFPEQLKNRSAVGSPTVGGGVKVADIVRDPSELRRVYEPGHPDADAEGYVSYPNVNSVLEMVDMISATRAYEANVATHNAARSMALKALEIGR
ncbi:MAG: flagellar basal body rod protein FlgC [Symbiobacteriaceae bacterium]|nr:flagellar basal body rod protein FlgC [Symbiobacteriaceae bacterium]